MQGIHSSNLQKLARRTCASSGNDKLVKRKIFYKTKLGSLVETRIMGYKHSHFFSVKKIKLAFKANLCFGKKYFGIGKILKLLIEPHSLPFG